MNEVIRVVAALSDATFVDFVQQDRLVIVEFWAPWCSRCKQLEPILEEIANQYQDHISIGKLNIETDQGIPAEFGVLNLPTLLIYKRGSLVGNVTGFLQKKALEDAIHHLS